MLPRLKGTLFAALLWAGCGGGLLTIPVDETATTTIAPGTLLEDLLGDLGFDAFLDMDVTASEELQNQGVEPGDVVEVRLTTFTLEATEPAGADLSFLSGLAVYVESEGLDKVEIAHADAFPEGQALVDFEIDDVDLTDYVVSQSMTITTEVTGHRPDQETTVEASFSVDVGVTVQGACNQATAE